MDSLATPALLAVLAGGAAATWVAGIFLSKATDRIDDHFDLGQALGGMLLLGIAGTLPEIAITVSAALSGHLDIAVGNLLGGIAMQTLVLVILDFTSRNKRPLSNLSNSLEPLHEAALVIAVVGIAVMGTQLAASATIGPVSPASLAIVFVWLLGIFALNRNRRSPRWQSTDPLASPTPTPTPEPTSQKKGKPAGRSRSIGGTLAVFGVASAVTLVSGVLLEQSGYALADDFGINGAIFGATVLAAITALPEISTGLAAVRMGQVGLAMGDIFGGNAIQVTLFLVADLLAGQAVLTTASVESIWLACLGIVVTAIYLNGLITRPERKVLGLGSDSLAVAVAYALGVVGLLFLTS
jgi:cation:H+ antiporter